MTSNYHTPHPFGDPLDSAVLNDPLGDLDSALSVAVASGFVGASTTTDASSASGQKVVPVTATTGFVVGDPVWIGFPGSGLVEMGTVNTIQAGISLTMLANLTNTHATGTPVSRSPIEIVDARGTFATLGTRMTLLAGRVYDPVGTVGNGVADDKSAIQAAIDLASAAGGGTVLLRKGTFLISDALLLTANVTLQGQGSSTVVKTSANTPAIQATSVDGVVVRDLAITGNNNAAHTSNRGVHFTSVTNGRVENVRPTNCFRGMSIVSSTDLVIRDCVVSGDKSDLGAIDVSTSFNVSVIDCRVINPTTQGIDFREGGADHKAINCQVSGAGDTGIVVSGSSAPGTSIPGCLLQGNVIREGLHGIVVENGAYYTRVIGNFIYSPSGLGISVGQGTGDAPADTVIEGNVVVGSGTHAIFGNGANYTVVKGNRIVGYIDDAIRLAIGISHTIEGNIITDGTSTTGAAIKVYAGAAGSSVVGNVIRNVAGQGILIDAVSCTVTGNTVVDSDNTGVLTVGGIQLTADADRTSVSANVSRRISGTKQDYGIQILAGCVNAQIIGNSLFENTTGAISDAGTGTSSVNNITA